MPTRFSRWFERPSDPWALAMAVVVAPYFLLTGWLNAGAALLGLVALWQVTAGGHWRQLAGHRGLALLAAALAAPLVATALVQATHGEFIARHFDAPLRMALAAALLVLLHARRTDWLHGAEVAIPASLYLCAALIFAPGSQRFYWSGRVASYFMDPLMLALHATILGFMCLFLLGPGDSRAMRVFKAGGWLAGMVIAFVTGSRTGWIAMPLLALLWFHSVGGLRRGRDRLYVLLLISGAALLLYAGSDLVRERIDLVAAEVAAYAQGGQRDTSIGIRLSLYQLSWSAFMERPWTGWGFAALPAAQSLPGTSHLWTAIVSDTMRLHGPHNDFLQAMMRMGLSGLVSRMLLFGAPLVLFAFACACRAGAGAPRKAGYLGLVVVIGFVTGALTSEVTNLVYGASFYGLMVASLGAVALSPRQA